MLFVTSSCSDIRRTCAVLCCVALHTACSISQRDLLCDGGVRNIRCLCVAVLRRSSSSFFLLSSFSSPCCLLSASLLFSRQYVISSPGIRPALLLLCWLVFVCVFKALLRSPCRGFCVVVVVACLSVVVSRSGCSRRPWW